MENAMEGIWVGMICSLIIWGIIILVGMTVAGCSGRVYAGYERSDTVEYKTTMVDKPWYEVWFPKEQSK